VPKIFVSYRRSDSQGWAGRLGDALVTGFGDVALFFDIESIEGGDDFVEAIERSLAQCEVVLVLIGPAWLAAADAKGRQRLDDPADFVRVEIETALGRNIRVIPVLLGGAGMPQATSLPASLAPLTRRQAIELSDSRWEFDCGRLADLIERKTSLRRRAAPQGEQGGSVQVGEGVVIEGASVGDVAGIKGDAATAATDATRIEVAKDATIRGSTVGDIVGVKVTKLPKEGG
jgi:hypothetical protein